MKTFVPLVFCMMFLASRADATPITMPGVGCVPDSSSIQANTYTTANGAILFAPGKTGQITLHCPLAAQATLNNFGVYYKFMYIDPSPNSGDHVVINVYSMAKSNGSLAYLAGADSKVGSVCTHGTSSVVTCYAYTSGNLDPTNYIYFVEVYLMRASTTYNESFYGLDVN